MKKIAFLAILFSMGLYGCATTDAINEETGTVYTYGAIIRKTGQFNCQISVKTDRYGVYTTGLLLPETCDKYKEKMTVRVEIKNGEMEILGYLP